MHEVTVGNISIGRLPRVAGVIKTNRGLAQLATDPVDPVCDLVEVRLGKGEVEIEGNHWVNECLAIEARGIPVLITIREQSEGGPWADEDARRIPLFETALEEFSIVDIELNSKCFYRVLECAEQHQKPVIISYHDFQSTPSLEEFNRIQERIPDSDNIILKIATMTHNAGDVAVLQEFLLAPHPFPVCVLGMGETGVETRLRFPELGSCLTYGYLDAPSAVRQHPSEELVNTLRKRIPEYAEDLRHRGRVADA